jgi:hypothetical protein
MPDLRSIWTLRLTATSTDLVRRASVGRRSHLSSLALEPLVEHQRIGEELRRPVHINVARVPRPDGVRTLDPASDPRPPGPKILRRAEMQVGASGRIKVRAVTR